MEGGGAGGGAGGFVNSALFTNHTPWLLKSEGAAAAGEKHSTHCHKLVFRETPLSQKKMKKNGSAFFCAKKTKQKTPHRDKGG
jgi:hypothetical protein